MPKIPLARNRISEQALPGTKATVRRDASAFDASTGLSQIAGAATDVFTKIEKEARNRAEDAQFNELQTREMAERDRLMHDKESGYTLTRGMQANEQFKGTQGDHGKFVDGELAGIASERVKERYKAYSDRAKVQMSGGMNRHAGNEMQRHEEETTSSLVNQLMQSSVENYDQPGFPDENGNPTSVIQNNIKDQDAAIARLGKNKGMGPEQIKQLQMQAKSKTHAAIVSRFLNTGDDLSAKQYFEQVRDIGQLDAKTITSVEGMVRSASIKGESQRIVGDAMTSGKSYTENIAAIRAGTEDPTIKDASVTRYKQEYAEQEAAVQQEQKAFYESKGDEVFADPENFELSAEDNAKLSFQQQKSLMQSKHQATMSKRGQGIKTKFSVWDKINQMSDEDFHNVDLNEYANDISTGDLKGFSDRKKDMSKHKQLQSAGQFASSMVKSAGLDKDSEDATYLRGLFESELNMIPKDKQQAPGVKEAIRDRLFLEMDSDEYFSMDKPYWKARRTGMKTHKPSGGKPKSVPRDAVWVDEMNNGHRTMGWKAIDPSTGRPTIFNQKGDPAFTFSK